MLAKDMSLTLVFPLRRVGECTATFLVSESILILPLKQLLKKRL